MQPLAKALLEGRLANGGVVVIGERDGGLTLVYPEPSPQPAP